MTNSLHQLSDRTSDQPSLEDYFIQTGFYDLTPLAIQLATDLGYDQNEVIEAVYKVNDKYFQYLPTKSRTAWFRMVFREKLQEARGEILTFRASEQVRNIGELIGKYV